jgi:alkylation response protein AidB-like acyl-CoA dehydrogenase
LVARSLGDAFVLDGAIPWVTGAAHADYLVIGVVTDTGMQVLAALPGDLPGVHIGPALELMALQGSMTAEVCLEQVTLDRRWLLAGPAERVLVTGGAADRAAWKRHAWLSAWPGRQSIT